MDGTFPKFFNASFNDEDVDGVSLVTDYDLIKRMQLELNKCTSLGGGFLPGNWPVSLSQDNITQLASNSYVVAPKPHGSRYFLYVDSVGDVYMENMKQNFFRLDSDRAVKLLSNDGKVLVDTILDGYIVRSSTGGRLTFYIHDAIRCFGVDLTTGDVIERIDIVQVHKTFFQSKFI